jgi:peroxiredoxin
MQNTISTIIILFLLIFFPIQAFSVDVGDKLPDFNISTLSGQVVQSAKIRGKNPLVLVFWATWCKSCVNEVPELKKLFSIYKPKGVEFLAVNIGISDFIESIRPFIKKHDICYPIALDKKTSLTNRFDILAIPMIIISDLQGVVRYRSPSVPVSLERYLSAGKTD